MIMGGVTDLSMPTSATNEPSSSTDTKDSAAQDFAALLAAWFAPSAIPMTPEATPTADLSSEQSGCQLAVSSDQPASAPPTLPPTLQSDVATEPPALPASIFAETSQMEITAATIQQKMAAAAAAATATPNASLPVPTATSTPSSTAGATSTGFEVLDYADSNVPEPQSEPTPVSFETGSVKLAARVVKEILGETKPAAPLSQTPGTGDFSSADSQAEPTLGKPDESARIETSALSVDTVETDAAPAESAHAGVVTSPVQAATTANATASVVNNNNTPHPVVHQTIDPLLDLAQQTAHRETRSMRFNLHPEELGRVEVEVTRDAQGRVSASLNAERIDAADSLTQGISHLRDALENAGIKVDHLDVYATPQFQNNGQGQTAQQQSSHTPRALPAEQLLADQVSEEGPITREEEKLLNLRA